MSLNNIVLPDFIIVDFYQKALYADMEKATQAFTETFHGYKFLGKTFKKL